MAALVWYGWEIVDTSLLIDERSASDLQFPMWLYYLSLPVGSALMLLRYGIRLVRLVLFYEPTLVALGHAPGHELAGGVSLPPVD